MLRFDEIIVQWQGTDAKGLAKSVNSANTYGNDA